MSIPSSEFLNECRKKLVNALGDDKDKYFFHMKQWFRMKVTKEEFDTNARMLLPSELVHLHNEFLLAILAKCQLVISPPSSSSYVPIKTEVYFEDQYIERVLPNSVSGSSSSERRKMKQKKKAKIVSPIAKNDFVPVCLEDIAPTSNLREPSTLAEANPGYHSRSLYLLEPGNLKGRLLLASWDYGLTGIKDNVASLLHEAAKQILKNILMAVISKRKGYCVREGKFVHSLGTLPANPWLRNSASLYDWSSESVGFPFSDGDASLRPVWPTVDADEQNAAQLASCAPSQDPLLPPISSFDLFSTLQMDKSVIPCHSVYSLNMERISSRLWHPGWAELEQEAVAVKEASIRDHLREQRLATNPVG